MTPVSNPFPLFTDTQSQIAEGARIYIGLPNQDPETAPANVFWDAEMTIPAEQPLRTTAGYIVNGGSPAQPYVDGSYSIRVRQANGAVVYAAAAVLVAETIPVISRATLADLKAAKTSDINSLYNGSLYTWTPGNFTGQADDYRVVQADDVALSAGAWVRTDGPLYAGNFGVRDDPNIGTALNFDQRAAVQAFEDLCRSLKRDSNYGALRIAVGKPGVVHRGAGIFFDGCSTGFGDPGFYPLFGASNYTVLTMLGRCAGRVMVSGWGETGLTFDAANNITADTRPQVNGIVIGGDQTLVETANRCVFDHIAAPIIGGVGVDIYGVFDCAFMQITIEGSGKNGSPAFRIRDGNMGQSQTSNEMFIGRLQVERGVHQVIDISVNTLSVNIAKVHSEGGRGVAGVPTWRIGAASSWFGPMRLAARTNAGQDTTIATAQISGANTEFVAYRGEGFQTLYSGQGADGLTLTEAAGRFKPFPNQTGMTRFRGGNFTIQDADGFTTLDSCNVQSMTCGFVTTGTRTTATNCAIASLSASSTQAAIDCIHCTVKLTPAQTFGSIRFLSGTEVSPTASTTLTFGYQSVVLDAASRITATLTVDFCGFEWNGRVVGAVNFTTALRTIVGANASATAGAFNYAPPTGAEFIGPLVNAQRTKNPAWVAGGIPGWLYATGNSAWHPEPIVA